MTQFRPRPIGRARPRFSQVDANRTPRLWRCLISVAAYLLGD